MGALGLASETWDSTTREYIMGAPFKRSLGGIERSPHHNCFRANAALL